MEGADGDAADGAFTVLSQKVDLDISFSPKLVKGRTEITIQPKDASLRAIRLDCRQLTPTHVKVQGRQAYYSYDDLYQRLRLFGHTSVYQYHFPKKRIERHRAGTDEELIIYLPSNVHVRAIDPFTALSQEPLRANSGKGDGLGNGAPLDTPTVKTGTDGLMFAPMKIEIEYEIKDFRDGIHFAGMDDGDARYPHAYSRNSPFAGIASCIFPCIDDTSTRCLWEISIRCPRTLGDIYKKSAPLLNGANSRAVQNVATSNSVLNGSEDADIAMSDTSESSVGLTEEEKSLEISVICSGDMTDDIVDPSDPTRKTVTFSCHVPVLAQHVGFAVGPFEYVDLSDFRDTEDDERLGSNAVRVHGFCLPGRADEVRNSSLMLARALDKFAEKYMSYPFTSYKLCFVDDLTGDVANTASFSICSSRLLFPDTIWDPLEDTTRTLVHALASQWIGINVISDFPSDWWIIIGGSWFMTDLYLRDLFGRNDYRFRLKTMSDRVAEIDQRRPSIYTLGEFLALDDGERKFMELKAPLVLAILNHRLIKQSGKNGVDRCLWRLFLNTRTGKLANGAISTSTFSDICEKVGHLKMESFFNQWVYGSGSPHFECYVSFNKKKLVVQMTIKQIQNDPTLRQKDEFLKSSEFMREAKELTYRVPQESSQTAFVGPMTIRIHEADGTPYEHIVDINSTTTKVEIPYNTKYKRLKRSRRQRERVAAAQGLDVSGEAQEEVTLYMLGDVLGSAEEMAEWRIAEWSKEDEERMEGESYEWLRVDADFEWICKTHINDMPGYMYVSQLQQDKDVVAQVEYLSKKEGHRLISSFMVKTLMDQRYFHAIRVRAAEVLAGCAKPDLGWIGFFHLERAFRELYCIPGSPMTRPNDFSDRSAYIIQCAIAKAIAQIKDNNGKAPMRVKRFLIDTIRYNENRGNHYADDYYLATLHACLAQSLTTTRGGNSSFNMSYEDEADEYEFRQKAIEELGRLQRLDEWIPSFHNIHTITVLDSALLLMKNSVTPFNPPEFIQYVRVGNADNVRLKAWQCLMDLGELRNPAVLKLMMYSIESDPSPHFRSELIHTFGIALGQVALGELEDLDKPTESANGLIIEQEEGTSGRETQLTRKRNIEGAIAGLKADLAANKSLQKAFQDTLRSDITSIEEFLELLDMCTLLYEPKNELRITLKYPRYWRVEHLGNGKLRFYHGEKVRVQPRKVPKLTIKAPALKQDDRPKRSPTLVLKNKPLGAPVLDPRALSGTADVAQSSTLVRETILVSPKQQRYTASQPPASSPVPPPKLQLTPQPLPETLKSPPPPPTPAPSALPRAPSIIAGSSKVSASQPPPLARPTIKIPKIAPPPRASPSPPTPGPIPTPAPPSRQGSKAANPKSQRQPKGSKPKKSLLTVLRLPPRKLAQWPVGTSSVPTGSAANRGPTPKPTVKRARDDDNDSEDDRPLKRMASTERVNLVNGRASGGRPREGTINGRKSLIVKLKMPKRYFQK